jgi:hypothetical protein
MAGMRFTKDRGTYLHFGAKSGAIIRLAAIVIAIVAMMYGCGESSWYDATAGSFSSSTQ